MASVELDSHQLDFLRGLVRMNRRKKQKDIDRFQARPGQSASEVAEVQVKFQAQLEFVGQVLQVLEEAHHAKGK